MNVLSIFDGISCAQVALNRVGYKVENYFASEIDKHAIAVTQKNFPNTIQLGDVRNVVPSDTPIDLLIGGFPCQDLSIAKAGRTGLKGARSGLFSECLRLLDEMKPRYFIFENVASMDIHDRVKINDLIGIKGKEIDAALFSAQTRKRIFWTNIKVKPLPLSCGTVLRDIAETQVDDKYYLKPPYNIRVTRGNKAQIGFCDNNVQGNRIYSADGKTVTLTANGGGRGSKTGLYYFGAASRTRNGKQNIELNGTQKSNCLTGVSTDFLTFDGNEVRRLTPLECERLQGLSDGYTDGINIAETNRLRSINNGFHVDVVSHILSSI